MHYTLLTRQSIVLAVDMMHGHGPSYKMHLQLQPKKGCVIALQALYITNKAERFSFSRRCVKQVSKRLKKTIVYSVTVAITD